MDQNTICGDLIPKNVSSRSDVFLCEVGMRGFFCTIHEEKKHGIISRNFAVLYHGSCCGIMPRKLYLEFMLSLVDRSNSKATRTYQLLFLN